MLENLSALVTNPNLAWTRRYKGESMKTILRKCPHKDDTLCEMTICSDCEIYLEVMRQEDKRLADSMRSYRKQENSFAEGGW